MIEERTELLARLLANENIDVIQDGLPTAYFDTRARVLHLPNWDSLHSNELEMLIGHEVGHALFTPSDLWINTIKNFDGDQEVFKHCLNVVEDARIERKIKTRYPGLKRTFYFGYMFLYDRGIFELSEHNMKYILNRLNYYFKIRDMVMFTRTDKKFWGYVDRIAIVETFEEVINIAKDLYAECVLEDAVFKNDIPDQGEQEQAGEGEDEGTGESKESEEKSEKELKESLEKTKGESKEETQNNNSEKKFSEDYLSDTDTEKKLKEFLHNLAKSEGKNANVFMPEPILENIILPYQEILNIIKDRPHIAPVEKDSEEEDGDEEIYDMTVSSSIKSFNKQYSASINYYKKVFEMKKKAIEYKKILQFKTGKLDMNMLKNYKFDENIFLSHKVTEKGKNHGLIIYIDMSSSMKVHNYKNVLTQMLELVSFCRAINIPVSVYGFSNSDYATTALLNYLYKTGKLEKRNSYSYYNTFQDLKQWKFSNNTNDGDSNIDRFCLLEFFSPKMTNKEFINMFDFIVSGSFSKFSIFRLNGTPLVSAIGTLDAITNKFRNETAAQVINITFITDGAATDTGYYSCRRDYNHYTNINIHDPKTKKFVNINKLQEKLNSNKCFNSSGFLYVAAILTLQKMRMKNVNVVNFYLDRGLGYFSNLTSKKDNKFYIISEYKCMEFDEFYIVNPEAFNKNIREKIVNEHNVIGKYGRLINGVWINSSITPMEKIKDEFVLLGKMMKEKQTMINSFITKICE